MVTEGRRQLLIVLSIWVGQELRPGRQKLTERGSRHGERQVGVSAQSIMERKKHKAR